MSASVGAVRVSGTGSVVPRCLTPCHACPESHTAYERGNDVWPIRDQRVDAPVEQPPRSVRGVNGPYLHAEAGTMRVVDEARRHDPRRAGEFRNLITAVADARHRPAAPRSVQRPSHFFARRTRRNLRFEAPGRMEHAVSERAETHAVDCAGL